MGIVLIASLFTALMGMDGSLRLYLIYYTRWSLLVVETYLVCAALASRRHALFLGELETARGSSFNPSQSFTFLAAAISAATEEQSKLTLSRASKQPINDSETASSSSSPDSSSPAPYVDGTAPLNDRVAASYGSAASAWAQHTMLRGESGEGSGGDGEEAKDEGDSRFPEWPDSWFQYQTLPLSAQTPSPSPPLPGGAAPSPHAATVSANGGGDGPRVAVGASSIADSAWLSRGGGPANEEWFNKPVRPDSLIRLTWILQNIIFPNTLLVAAIFWFIIYPGVTFNGSGTSTDDLSSAHDAAGAADGGADSSNYDNYSEWRYVMVCQEHGMNFVVIAVDVFLSRAPFRLAHTAHAATYSAVYLAFSFWYYLAYGTNDNGAPYIYPQLNWATPVPTGCLVVAFYVLALPLTMLLTWSLWFVGRALGARVATRRAL